MIRDSEIQLGGVDSKVCNWLHTGKIQTEIANPSKQKNDLSQQDEERVIVLPL